MPSKRTALLLNIFFSLGQMFLLPQPTQAAGINVVSDYGAIGDGIVLSDASITSGTNLLSSPSHPFVSADVGKQVALWAGGAGGFGLATTISSVSGGNALLASNAITTVTNGPAQVCTDNTAAFISARNFLITKNPTQYTLNIPPGTYCINNGRWLKGILNMAVNAYGANFIGMNNSGGYGIDAYGVNFGGDIFSDQDQADFDPSTSVSGFLLQNANINDHSVTLKTNTDSTNFQVGDDVLVFGFDSQGYVSYPPNPRFFEYDTITAINAGTGVITLQNPLRYAYNGAWYDAPPVYGVTMGAPRLLDLNRTKMKISQNVTFSGGTFLSWYGSVNANARMLAGTIDATGARNITGHLGGRGTRVMFSGTMRRCDRCQPA
jgi:hypothetical protein